MNNILKVKNANGEWIGIEAIRGEKGEKGESVYYSDTSSDTVDVTVRSGGTQTYEVGATGSLRVDVETDVKHFIEIDGYINPYNGQYILFDVNYKNGEGENISYTATPGEYAIEPFELDLHGVDYYTIIPHFCTNSYTVKVTSEPTISAEVKDGSIDIGKLKGEIVASLTPPALTDVTPRGTKIGDAGWTGTGFFCTAADTLYAITNTNVPNNTAYTRFCLRPVSLDNRNYLNWTPYFVSGDTEIEFFWSPVRGLYEGLVLTTDESAEDFLANHIVWKFHPPVEMRYGKISNAIFRYATVNADATETVTYALRDSQSRRNFSGELNDDDYRIIYDASYAADMEQEWPMTSKLHENLSLTETSMLYLAWDLYGNGNVNHSRNWMQLQARITAASETPFTIEAIDNFA